MYNGNKPTADELPSSAQLLKSTIIAIVAAVIILVAIVLPAEYGIDPTRVGRALGLAQMGEIKQQLAEEVEQDHGALPALERQHAGFDLLGAIGSLFVTPAQAHDGHSDWDDQVELTLAPGQGIEVKLVMKKDDVVEYAWLAQNGVLNYDLHGDGPGGNGISYKKGRGVEGDQGSFAAAFDGNHGWFWRNRDKQDVVMTLVIRGAYTEIKQLD